VVDPTARFLKRNKRKRKKGMMRSQQNKGSKNPMTMKKGTRVKLKTNALTVAWAQNGKLGIIVGPDPRGCNKDVVAVEMDNGVTLFKIKGIHVDHLEIVKEKSVAATK
jgi:hypothetical protein